MFTLRSGEEEFKSRIILQIDPPITVEVTQKQTGIPARPGRTRGTESVPFGVAAVRIHCTHFAAATLVSTPTGAVRLTAIADAGTTGAGFDTGSAYASGCSHAKAVPNRNGKSQERYQPISQAALRFDPADSLTAGGIGAPAGAMW